MLALYLIQDSSDLVPHIIHLSIVKISLFLCPMEDVTAMSYLLT
jgi:hypothetical protein